jgi:hypothetical protein
VTRFQPLEARRQRRFRERQQREQAERDRAQAERAAVATEDDFFRVYRPTAAQLDDFQAATNRAATAIEGTTRALNQYGYRVTTRMATRMTNPNTNTIVAGETRMYRDALTNTTTTYVQGTDGMWHWVRTVQEDGAEWPGPPPGVQQRPDMQIAQHPPAWEPAVAQPGPDGETWATLTGHDGLTIGRPGPMPFGDGVVFEDERRAKYACPVCFQGVAESFCPNCASEAFMIDERRAFSRWPCSADKLRVGMWFVHSMEQEEPFAFRGETRHGRVVVRWRDGMEEQIRLHHGVVWVEP